MLKKVKSYIYNNLGLAKVNIIDPRKGDFVQPLKATELLTELQIADFLYQRMMISNYIFKGSLILAL